MNRQEKQAVITEMRTGFSDSQASFLVGVQGLTVNRVQKFRRLVRNEGGEVNVVKNTLLRVAVDGLAGVQNLAPHFEQQIAVVFAFKEPTAIARVIHATAQEDEQFKIVAGYLEGSVMNVDKIEYLATLPGRDQLVAKVCGGLKAPIANHTIVLKKILMQFMWVIKQASEKAQPEEMSL
jgi:large subunit ribosomal protein L10